MTFVLTEEQQMLQESTRRFMAARTPVNALRGLRDSNVHDGFSRQVWDEVAEIGLTGILIPEAFEGLGFGHVGAGLVCEQIGRNLAALPFLSTAVLGADAISTGASEVEKQRLLPEIAAGRHLVALAIDEGVRHAPDITQTTAKLHGGGYVLNGSKTFVIDGHVADTLIVSARTGDGLSLFLVDAKAPGVMVERVDMVDSHNMSRAEFRDVAVGADKLIGEADGASALIGRLLDIGRACLAAEMLGIAQEAFERTVGYLKERKQFGVTIGSFQGLQHRAAIMYAEIELTKSTVRRALEAIDADDTELAKWASLAKAKSCATVQLATNEAIQMHGGIGMTDEFDIGFFLKRARVAQQTFGDYGFHADRFARLNGY
jgi:alkylation response protein AidB-like acyl-CoA dehydrogenase